MKKTNKWINIGIVKSDIKRFWLLSVIIPFISLATSGGGAIIDHNRPGRAFIACFSQGTTAMIFVGCVVALAVFRLGSNKKEGEFMGSMPVNRKSIFGSKIISGISLIFIATIIIWIFLINAASSMVLSSEMNPRYFAVIFSTVFFTGLFMFMLTSAVSQVTTSAAVSIFMTFGIYMLPSIAFSLGKIVFPQLNKIYEVYWKVADFVAAPAGANFANCYLDPNIGMEMYHLKGLMAMSLVYGILGYWLFNKKKVEDTRLIRFFWMEIVVIIGVSSVIACLVTFRFVPIGTIKGRLAFMVFLTIVFSLILMIMRKKGFFGDKKSLKI